MVVVKYALAAADVLWSDQSAIHITEAGRAGGFTFRWLMATTSEESPLPYSTTAVGYGSFASY